MIRRASLPSPRKPVHLWMGALLVFMLIGLGAAAIVLVKGLSVTNLSDLVPWGLWISIDLTAIALSAGAFTISAFVYLLRRKELQPLARTAVYVGLIGYSMAMMMLLLDIGRPDRFWHGFVFWNIHSPLWEVTMCVGLYFSVLALEVAPIFGHWSAVESRFPRLSRHLTSIHRLAPFLALAGLCLSTLHQSSLGLTYGKLAARPIWYRPWPMAINFYVSAIVGGLALVTLISLVSSKLSPRARVNRELLAKLSLIVGWFALGLLALRWLDLMTMPTVYEPATTEALYILTRGRLAFNFWFLEIILGLLVPAALLLISWTRRIERLQIVALALIVVGVIAFRWDTNLVGQLVVFGQVNPSNMLYYTTYSPSLIEILAGVGVLAYGLFAVTFGVRYLNVINHGDAVEAPAEATVSAAMVPSSYR
ncbi:MAG: NrfD/PsrC family molybdoenzyme membrane anchor subunit [Chloroflexota bacterium]|jgi:Ni/Fe-hydrogenase subunit HybB-like protein